ncbi:hypothetical protein B0T17DRAFT_488274 [Bombardia bombarda]|uniref:Uncharacterized protein n=1 Tax=Bombardia bombarda TaxID=252184 RepID=A0AA40C8T4_9PEZI|nr:hypothetical protein B0T17DRAFT_488274 [Bombardia bombarda]
MRYWQTRPASLAALGLLLAGSAVAHPYPADDLHEAGYGYLMPRQCAKYCGVDNNICCAAGDTCTTYANNVATCLGGGDSYQYSTSTWTLTQTFTTTYSSLIPAATPGGGADCVPQAGTGQIACGSICCTNQQYCAYAGQCLANPVGGGGGGLSSGITTGGVPITTGYSAPYRPTSIVTTTTGTAAGATTTGAAVSPGGTAAALSPGAIAGIVIGSLAGVALLLLLCACCVVRGLWHTVVALFGGGKKRRTKETIVEEERYTRRGSTHSRRDEHGSWYSGAVGGRPSAAASRKEKKSSSGKGLLGIGALLGTLWLLLGLRKDNKKKKSAPRTRSDVSSGYFSDSYTADSPSE